MATVEICLDADDLTLLKRNVKAVNKAAAHRIELCSNMLHQGLMPSLEAIRVARESFSPKGLMVMIRPRAGHFYYNQAELNSMLIDIKLAADLGADGVVFGTLAADLSTIDIKALELLTRQAKQSQLRVGFHRAFDAVTDRKGAMQHLISAGVDQVLTSGSYWGSSCSALEGVGELANTISAANGQLEVVIAGGIGPDSGVKLFDAIGGLSGPVAFHAHSGVLIKNKVDLEKVSGLVAIDTDGISHL